MEVESANGAPSPQPSQPPTPGAGSASLTGLLIAACVFAIVGGYMDAYAYMAHGHVFACAQTGNFVLLAVDASGGQWVQAARHVPPIIAFALGVAVANLFGVRTEKHSFRATLLCEGCELIILTALTFAGNLLPDAWVVPIIAFLAALQNTSFGKVGPWSFNSAMTTGNLRNATTGLVLWLLGREAAQNRAKAIALGWVCLSFLAGAFAGGLDTRWDEKHALAPCVALVAVGLVLTWRERQRRLSQPA